VKRKTTFTASMDIFTNYFYVDNSPTPVNVTAYEPIYFKIKSGMNNSQLDFVTEDCWATPTPNPDHASRYLFFDEKCVIDETFKRYNEGIQNEFRYSIDAFNFIRLKGKVYFHCGLLVCKHGSTTDECTQLCKKYNRKRRYVEDKEAIERVIVNSGMISYVDKPTCKTTTCPTHSECVEIFPAQCRCSHGYVFNQLTLKCSDEHIYVVNGLHLVLEFQDEYHYTTSREFQMLANKVEEELLKLVDINVNEGLKVVRATPGSVVLDLELIRSSRNTTEEAFKHLIDNIYNSQNTITIALNINSQIQPTIKAAPKIKSQIRTTTTTTITTTTNPEDLLKDVENVVLDNSKLIIAVVVAAAVVTLLLVTTIVVIVVKRK
jgi:hypothetical protein